MHCSVTKANKPYVVSQGVSKTLVWAVATAAIGSGFQHGYNIGVLNTPEKVIKDWMEEEGNFYPRKDKEQHEEDVLLVWSVIVSMFCVGGMFGGASTSIVANKLGRRMGLILNNIFAIFAGIVFGTSKLAKTFSFLIIGRFIIGFNAGLNAGLAPLYVNEISPTNIRGATGSMYQLSITISIFIANLLGYKEILGTEELWPLLTAMVAFVGVYQIIALIFCPETPKFLLEKKNDADNARKVTQKLAGDKVDEQYAEVEKDIQDAKNQPAVKVKDMFQQQKLRRPLYIICFLMWAQQLSGINAVMFYSTAIFEMSKISITVSQQNSVGVMALNVLTTVLSVYLVEKSGRKSLLLLSFGGMIITTAVLTGSLFYVVDNEGARLTAIVMVYAYVFFFAIGAGSIPWLLGPELFNTASRPLACSIAVLTNWFFNFVVGIAFRPLQNTMGAAVFSIFLICQIIAVVIIWFYVPETKNKPINEITALFE